MKKYNQQESTFENELSLTLTADSGAIADGQATNKIKVLLQNSGLVVPDKDIDLFALSATAHFSNSLNHITVTTNPLGDTIAKLTDSVAEEVTVRAIVLSDPSVSAEAKSTFGGCVSELSPPIVREMVNGTLSANLSQATVEIKNASEIELGDEVKLFWQGKKEDSSTTLYNDIVTVTESDPLTFIIPGVQQILPLSGGSVDIFYKVLSSNQKSPTLHLDINETEDSWLPAPLVREAPGGSLNGNLSSATVDIAPYAGMAAGDLIELGWTGDVTGNYTTDITVSGSTVGKTVSIFIPGTQITGNSLVALNYTVMPVSGGSMLMSWPLALKII